MAWDQNFWIFRLYDQPACRLLNNLQTQLGGKIRVHLSFSQLFAYAFLGTRAGVNPSDFVAVTMRHILPSLLCLFVFCFCSHGFFSNFFTECDKSFTRSDAMAKHMRLQHSISPPLPGRGGNRKRKRGDAGGVDGSSASASASAHGFGAFKVDAHTPTDVDSGNYDGTPVDERGDYFSRRPRSASPGAASEPSTAADGEHPRVLNPDRDDRDDVLPPHLAAALDPATGTIFGRSPPQARYLVMKAKHRFALEQHESLLEELRVVRCEERRMRVAKETALDGLLRATLGSVQFPLLKSSCSY